MGFSRRNTHPLMDGKNFYPPPHLTFPDPLPLGISVTLHGGYGYFLEQHFAKFFFEVVKTYRSRLKLRVHPEEEIFRFRSPLLPVFPEPSTFFPNPFKEEIPVCHLSGKCVFFSGITQQRSLKSTNFSSSCCKE